ncbi:MAG: sn-glycerol-3-phosphate ABC transporter ATP-binding protein UgpC [Rhodobacter sp.]|nr:sn-glycerol-3-phosphate ABC transporter ATP-binding protein UgpC [Rhodobacter sp.]
MGAINLDDIHKFFGEVHVIKGVDLEITEGEFVVFVGPSGCGKSTMLRLISGLEEATSGHVQIQGKDVTALGAAERGLAMVFQSYALYPHMTVRENMGFGLKIAGEGKSAQADAVQRAADILQLGPLLDRKPKELSGGQRQRVAIGRAIVREPAAFLFDEPLSNLDAALRVQMRIEIARLHRRLGKTMIYVTHDQVEAMTLADRIVVFDAGVIQQQGAPLDLYRRPSNLFVATFIGSPKMNILPCQPTDGGVRITDGTDIVRPGIQGEPRHFGIRPEHIRLVPPDEAILTGTVGVAEHLGGDSFIYVDIEGLDPVNVRVAGGAEITEDQTVGLAFDLADTHLFGADELRIEVA